MPMVDRHLMSASRMCGAKETSHVSAAMRTPLGGCSLPDAAAS